MYKKVTSCMKRCIAAAMVLALVGGITPVAPITGIASRASITAMALDGTETEIGFRLGADGVLTISAGTYNDPVFNDSLDKSDVYEIQVEDGVVFTGSCAGLFSGFGNVTYINLSGANTSGVTDMSGMFEYLSNLTEVDISGLDARGVTTLSGMFQSNPYSASHLDTVNMTGFTTSNKLQDTSAMFSQCSLLVSLDLSGLDTSNVTNMSKMFRECSSLTSLNIDVLDTSNAVDMSEMFTFCTDFCGLDPYTLNTSKAENISKLFSGCNFETFDVSQFDFSNVTDMSGLFYSCGYLKSVNMSGMDLSRVKDMSWMFYYCGVLESVDFTNTTTLALEDTNNMFFNCASLESIDLSSFSTPNLKNTSEMFKFYDYHAYAGELSPSTALRSITLGPGFVTSNVEDMHEMFYGCKLLESLDLSSFDTTNNPNMSNLFGQWTQNLKSITLSDKMNIGAECHLANKETQFMNTDGWYVEGDPDQEIISGDTFRAAELSAAAPGQTVTYRAMSNAPDVTYTFSDGVLTVHSGAFDGNNRKFSVGIGKMAYIPAIKKIVAESGVSFTGYLSSCISSSYVEEVDFSEADMTAVTSMTGMFSGCSNLKNVSLGQTSSTLGSLSTLLSGLSKLETADLSRLDTSAVTNMQNMFSGCKKLSSIDLSSFSDQSLTSYSGMFTSCGIKEITIPDSFSVQTGMNLKNSGVSEDKTLETVGWYKGNDDTTIVSGSNTGAEFSGQGTYRMKEQETEIKYELSGDELILKQGGYAYGDISGIVSYIKDNYDVVVTKITAKNPVYFKNSSEYFSGITGLKEVDLSEADFTQTTSMSGMFSGCTDLERVEFGSNATTSNVTSMSNMFNGCSALTYVSMSSLDTSNVTYFSSMFKGCKKLALIDLSNFSVASVTSTYALDYIFENCDALRTITLPAGMNVTDRCRLGNSNSNSDYTERVLGWKAQNGDEIISGTGTYAVLSGPGTFVAVTDPLTYSYNSGVLTIESGTYDKTTMKAVASKLLTDLNKLKKVIVKGGVVFVGDCSNMFVFNDYGKGVEVVLDGKVDATKATYITGMFRKCRGNTLDLGNLKISGITDLSSFLYGSSYKKVLIGPDFDTSAVTNMSYMFCSSSTVDFPFDQFDASAAVNVSSMFKDCTSADRLDISSLSIPAATNFEDMFSGSSLNSIDLNDLDITKIEKMKNMFKSCQKLSSFTMNTANIDLSSLKDVSNLFSGCSQLSEINFSGQGASYVKNMESTFAACTSLTTIDMSMFAGAKPQTLKNTFQGCSALKRFTNLDSVDFGYGTYWLGTFDGCSSLEEIDASGFKHNSNSYSSTAGYSYMFRNCAKLKSLDLRNLQLKSFEMKEMFKGCSSLETLIMDNDSSKLPTNSSYYQDMFEGADNLNDITIPDGMAVNTSYHKLVNGDVNYTGWYYADDDEKTIVSGSADYASIASDTTKTHHLKRDEKTYQNSQLIGASLTLEGQIGVNFYLQFPDELIQNENAYAVLSTDSKGEQRIYLNDSEFDRLKGYKFTYKLPAKMIHDKVTISIYDGTTGEPLALVSSDGTPVENNQFSFAIIDYINAVKDNTSYTQSHRNLVKALEIYGTYAQAYFDHDNQAEYLSSCDQTALNTVNGYTYETLAGNKYSASDLPDGLRLSAYSLILDSETSMKVFFTTDNIDAYIMRFLSANGSEEPVKCGDNKYYLKVENIAANNLGKYYYIQVKDKANDDYYSVDVSPLNYAYSALYQLRDSTNEKDIALCNTVKAMYYYYICAKSYFG